MSCVDRGDDFVLCILAESICGGSLGVVEMGKDGVEEVDPQKDVEATKSGSWFWAKVRWFSVFVLGISILVALLQSQKVPESVVK